MIDGAQVWSGVLWAALLHDEESERASDEAPWMRACDVTNSSTAHLLNFSHAAGQEQRLTFDGSGQRRQAGYGDLVAGYTLQRVLTPLQALQVHDAEIGVAGLSAVAFVNEALLLLWFVSASRSGCLISR